MTSRGYTADQFVRIVSRNMTKEDALNAERARLSAGELPRFNKPQWTLKPARDRWDSIRDEALLLREKGLSYKAIGDKLGYSAMLIWRNMKKEIRR